MTDTLIIKRTIRTYAIAHYLLSGWTPWGVQLNSDPMLIRCGPESGRRRVGWIMCCGHVLAPHEVDRWWLAGLVKYGPHDQQGRPTLIKGPRLAAWVSHAWHGLRAQTWNARP